MARSRRAPQFALLTFALVEPAPARREQLVDLGMAHRLAGIVGQQILLRDVGDILRFFVLGEQVVERLVLRRPHLGGNGEVPFLRVREDRIDVVDHAAKGIEAVLDDLADGESGGAG